MPLFCEKKDEINSHKNIECLPFSSFLPKMYFFCADLLLYIRFYCHEIIIKLKNISIRGYWRSFFLSHRSSYYSLENILIHSIKGCNYNEIDSEEQFFIYVHICYCNLFISFLSLVIYSIFFPLFLCCIIIFYIFGEKM